MNFVTLMSLILGIHFRSEFISWIKGLPSLVNTDDMEKYLGKVNIEKTKPPTSHNILFKSLSVMFVTFFTPNFHQLFQALGHQVKGTKILEMWSVRCSVEVIFSISLIDKIPYFFKVLLKLMRIVLVVNWRVSYTFISQDPSKSYDFYC